jgi:Pyruvate/2-oxoacid:ferredoxin oxidoreductase delta subunit
MKSDESRTAAEVYRRLCKAMEKRGGEYPGMEIPEFYDLVKELFTPEEAEVCLAIPRGYHPASAIAAEMGKEPEEVEHVLEAMANKGVYVAGNMGDTTFYGTVPFMPGIFDFQFMRGTSTPKDKKLARLIHDYKAAVDSFKGPSKVTFPTTRVIPVDRKVQAGNTIHTYDQVATYIGKYEPLAVSTCFCRHQAKLIDEKDDCGKPNEVCMQFGMGAQFVIDRGIGRKISKEEALDILKNCEEAGLVHSTINRQEIDWLCNCCDDHCVILQKALAQPKPGLALNSGFQPVRNPELCKACGVCVERCPPAALTMDERDVPKADLDRCIGCGVCASGCPEDAITLIDRPGTHVPPIDHKALKKAMKASQS